MVGLLVAFSGFMLMGKARDLFKLRATILKIEKSNHLIKEGVFLKTRNPMYCGMFILILGFSILSTNILALLLPLTFLLLVGRVFVRKEEKLMQDTFGEEYLEYKKAVRRWI
jgi:protein-S-isoprenylcysteine O-methyltransferase Ste14